MRVIVAMRVRSKIKILSILFAGYLVGYFFGSRLPSPLYIDHLSNIPLEMNSPMNVSWLVKSYLPKDPKEAFKIVANSSDKVKVYKGRQCGCITISFSRVVYRLPLPDRDLSIYFEFQDGDLKYGGAEMVKWFL